MRAQSGIGSTSNVLIYGNFAKIGRAISMKILNANIIFFRQAQSRKTFNQKLVFLFIFSFSAFDFNFH